MDEMGAGVALDQVNQRLMLGGLCRLCKDMMIIARGRVAAWRLFVVG